MKTLGLALKSGAAPRRQGKRLLSAKTALKRIMLCITRKEGQSVRIGQDVVVKVIGVRGSDVKLAFEAPGQFVCRDEMSEEEKDKFRQDFVPVAQ